MRKITFYLLNILCASSAIAQESVYQTRQPKEDPQMERVLEKLTIENEDLREVLSKLGLTVTGNATMPKEGRIATNLIVPTQERGNVLVRAYPEHVETKLETGVFGFEVRVLTHLSSHGLRVPSPLLFEGSTPLYNHKGQVYMVYPFISGNTLEKEDLSLDVAKKSGKFVSRMILAATQYEPKEGEILPDGDLDHLTKCLKLQSAKFPQILQNETFSQMEDFVNSENTKQLVSRSPQGVVHSDFFFENFVVDGDQTAAIDFGDAYYGSVVMDIAIAAMEFSAVDDQKWDFDFLKAFLAENLSWLKQHKFNHQDFIDIMKVNCLRFAIYTTPFTVGEGLILAENPYVLRFQYLNRPDVQGAVKNIFDEIDSQSGFTI